MSAASGAAAPSYRLHPVVALRVAATTPRLRRITLEARTIPGIHPGRPAQWLKVFVPKGAERSGGRAYTIRRCDSATGLIDLDIVLHGDTGDIAAWAARAEIGSAFEVSQPHPRSGHIIDPNVEDYVLAGDETGLPGIAAILEGLPATARARAVIEVADATEQQPLRSAASLTVTWLHRDTPGQPGLCEAVQDLPIAPRAAVWIAAEASQVRAIRADLSVRGFPGGRLYASGYWKRGEADHRDPDGGPS